MLPDVLYRGDSDNKQFRNLRNTINSGEFATQLLRGGIGKDIFKIPFDNLINRHVGYNWDRTHFLSFTDRENIALRYGIGCKPSEFEEKVPNYIPYYGDEKNWDFALLKLDTTSLNINKLNVGIFEGTFTPTLRKFLEITSVYRIILIDVVTVLSNAADPDGFAYSIENAEKDREWLLLPAVPIELNAGQFEYSGILDGGCLDYTKYSSDTNIHLGVFFG